MPRGQLLGDKALGRVKRMLFLFIHRHKQISSDVKTIQSSSSPLQSFLDQRHRVANKFRCAGIVKQNAISVLPRKAESRRPGGTEVNRQRTALFQIEAAPRWRDVESD